mmetsp:Transcript_6604/g.21013  ORF Transcript_6604/g.21013 Transcript_6604/m.21013 type:complete len:243 (+) Transcript_6604:464-1192(+)
MTSCRLRRRRRRTAAGQPTCRRCGSVTTLGAAREGAGGRCTRRTRSRRSHTGCTRGTGCPSPTSTCVRGTRSASRRGTSARASAPTTWSTTSAACPCGAAGECSALASSSLSRASRRRWFPTCASAYKCCAGTTPAGSASPASITRPRTGTRFGASFAACSTRRSCPRCTSCRPPSPTWLAPWRGSTSSSCMPSSSRVGAGGPGRSSAHVPSEAHPRWPSWTEERPSARRGGGGQTRQGNRG